MHLNTFFEMQVQKVHVTILQNWITKYMKKNVN
jgi:hypothetical protein